METSWKPRRKAWRRSGACRRSAFQLAAADRRALLEKESFVIERFPPPAVHLAAFCDGMDAVAKRGRSRRADHQRGRRLDRARRE
jgi:hypothetical protein